MKIFQAKQACRTVRVLLAVLASPAFADSSNGPNPYAAAFGFDLPSEASWGGWTRGDAGTLHAEWDVFNDKSHGGAADRTAAPDAGSFGVSSAWLGWSAGTFVSGTGNLYSFTLPQSFNIELAGAVPSSAVRVALQVETQGLFLDYGSFTLNDAKPSQSTQTYLKGGFPSPVGPVDVEHRLVIWDLPAPPDSFVFRFSSKEPHVSLTQVAVDIGPADSAGPVPDPDPSGGADRTVLAKLPAETLDTDLAARLHAQHPAWFPESWADRELAFTQKTDQSGKRINRSLKGGIQALFLDGKTGGSNRVFADIYRPDEAGDVKIAECLLKATKKRRWRKVELEGGTARFGTAMYRLGLAAVEFPQKPGKKARFKKRQGVCDIDPAAGGVQAGIPDFQEGDYAVFRREGG